MNMLQTTILVLFTKHAKAIDCLSLLQNGTFFLIHPVYISSMPQFIIVLVHSRIL